MNRMVLDAGAFIALDRNDRAMWARLAIAHRDRTPLVTHGGVIGEAWRNGRRQARLARALRAVDVKPLDLELGRRAGELMASSGTEDVIDAALVILCQPGDRVYTSDPDDLLLLASAGSHQEIEIVPV
jgi:hypothetical protein